MNANRREIQRMMRLLPGLVLVLSACAQAPSHDVTAGSLLSGASSQARVQAADLLEMVRALAAPETEGRATGSPGMERAARYIASEFQRVGLAPGGDAGGYFQAFDVITGVRLGERNLLRVRGQKGSQDYQPGQAFTPFGFSDNGRVEAQVVFAGYGITAPELGYDDYAGVDVSGKIVLVLSNEPRERDPGSPFRRPEAFRYTEVRYKVLNAREHGARGVILVTNPLAHGEEPEQLFGIRGITSVSQSGIVAVNALRQVAEAMLAGAGRSLLDLQRSIDQDLRPQSFLVADVGVELQVDLVRERGRGWNVIGVLRGNDPRLAEQAVVIGAHYDHLGLGGETSLAPSRYGEIHPGADDNASGVAGVLGLARMLAAAGGTKRTLVFVAFAGEEMGLLGSTQYARAPPFPLGRTVAMLNFDMIGRLRGETLYVYGVETGKEFRDALERANRDVGLRLRTSGDGYGPSDHTPFYAKDRPVLFFFTGPHEDYHRPSDTPDKINGPGLLRVVRLAAGVLRRIADADGAVTFARVEPSSTPPRGRPAGSGYGPYLGVIPEFGQDAEGGVKLGGVRAGSPAEKAGLQSGDVIIKFDGKGVRNLEDLVFMLRGKRAGDRVEVMYRRGSQVLTTSAMLEPRQ